MKLSEDYNLWSADNLFSLVHLKIAKNKNNFGSLSQIYKFKVFSTIQNSVCMCFIYFPIMTANRKLLSRKHHFRIQRYFAMPLLMKHLIFVSTFSYYFSSVSSSEPVLTLLCFQAAVIPFWQPPWLWTFNLT